MVERRLPKGIEDRLGSGLGRSKTACGSRADQKPVSYRTLSRSIRDLLRDLIARRVRSPTRDHNELRLNAIPLDQDD